MSTMTTRQPIRGSSAWRPSDFKTPAEYSVTLTDKHFKVFDAAVAANRRAGVKTEDMTRADFLLGAIASDVAAWRDEVMTGRGFVMLNRFPMDRYSLEDLEMIFYGLGTHFGRAVSQSSLGDRLGHVTDVGGKDRRERAYRNSRELTLHTDRTDLVAMLCVRQAMDGGVSGYSSAHTIYNDILTSRPELVEPLFTGWPYHRRGEQLPGEPIITPDRVPVLSDCEGALSTIYIRSYVEMAANEQGTPLSDLDTAALDYFDEVSNRDDVKLTFRMEPGQAIFFNNCMLLHNRTSFDDYDDPAKKRLLLRLWLMLDGARPLVPAAHAYKGTKGIQRFEGNSTYYRGDALGRGGSIGA